MVTLKQAFTNYINHILELDDDYIQEQDDESQARYEAGCLLDEGPNLVPENFLEEVEE